MSKNKHDRFSPIKIDDALKFKFSVTRSKMAHEEVISIFNLGYNPFDGFHDSIFYEWY
jgi:hypothetical protein